jgi:hypothetical protein
MSETIDRDTQVMLAVNLAGRATDHLAKVGYLPNNFHEYRVSLAHEFLPFLVRETWVSKSRAMHGLSGGSVSAVGEDHPEKAWRDQEEPEISIPLSIRGELLSHAIERLETQASLWAIWRTWPKTDWRNQQSNMFTTKVLENAQVLGAWLIAEAQTAGHLWWETQQALNMALVDQEDNDTIQVSKNDAKPHSTKSDILHTNAHETDGQIESVIEKVGQIQRARTLFSAKPASPSRSMK